MGWKDNKQVAIFLAESDLGVKGGERSSLFQPTRCMKAQAASTLELSALEHPAQPTPATTAELRRPCRRPRRPLAASFTATLSNACFLYASVLSGDRCLHAPGPESGRSSPYHSQLDVRSSTPTSYQAPKHFHIPGRRYQPTIPSMSACSVGVPDAEKSVPEGTPLPNQSPTPSSHNME